MNTTSTDPALLIGLASPDDAGVYLVAPDVAMVQTVDFFTPIVDDAGAWGRIAAANALSDIYAMGARPVTALNLVGWPRSLGFELLGSVVEGASEACDEAGVAVIGGHSIDDPEPKFGLAVTGLAHPDRLVRNTGAAPGNELVLTKPLGMGIISSGVKDGKTSAATEQQAIEIMSQLNRRASEAMLEVGVSAATDVTGFGLIGHLLEMLEDRLSAELSFESIPVLEEAFDLVEQGVLPGGSKRNYDAARDLVEAGGLDRASKLVLFDAQTSGGLLIAVDAAKTATLLKALDERGVRGHAIGTLSEGDGRITIS